MDTASTVIVSDNPKNMESAISQMLRQIDEIREQMKADDAEIVKIRADSTILRAESRVMRNETESILARVRENIWPMFDVFAV